MSCTKLLWLKKLKVFKPFKKEPTTRDLSDDNTKFEQKVLQALSWLQKGQNSCSGTSSFMGISHKKVVEYLMANYCNLDGDIESQVITALLSLVRSGLVCYLTNEKYYLLGPNPRTMSSKCWTKMSHGPRCCCLGMLSFMSRTAPKSCCVFNMKPNSTKKTCPTSKSKKMIAQRCVLQKELSRVKCRRGTDKSKQGTEKKNCESLEIGDAANVHCTCPKGDQQKAEGENSKYCKICHPAGSKPVVPYDTFSPREEVSQIY